MHISTDRKTDMHTCMHAYTLTCNMRRNTYIRTNIPRLRLMAQEKVLSIMDRRIESFFIAFFTCVRVRVCARAFILYIQRFTHVYVHVFVHTWISIYLYIYIYIYIYVYTHTHTYTYAYRCTFTYNIYIYI